MAKRVRQWALVGAVLLPLSLGSAGGSHGAAAPRCAARSADSLAAVACARLRAVPSLQPAATRTLWRELVRRGRARTFHATAGCRPLRAVFYAASDWLRLATKLAANASPCAQYYISIPPLAAAKTQFRSDQAWRISALAPNLHALAEVHMPGWRAWVTSTGSSWYEAGVEARRRMAAAGFDIAAGDGWIVNEFSSAVRRGLGSARAEARDFVHGLYDGAGGPRVKGGVFDIGVGQGLTDPSLYKSQLEGWLQDGAFWNDMSRYVSDWSQELYGDPRNYAVAGAPQATRRDYLTDYLRHQLLHVGLGGAATAAARGFLASADSPLANAAWQWDSGFGWTMVSAAQMEDYVSAQVYALRHFSAAAGEAQDHWGFAWAPRNASSLSSADFASQTGAIEERLAAAIHDSGQPDSADPGAAACGPPGQNLWCAATLPGAWLNDSWKTFTYWGQLGLAFAAPPQTLTAGAVSAPIVLQTKLGTLAHTTPTAMPVTLASSSPQGRFAPSPAGPWTSTLTVTIGAGGDTAPAVYYSDTVAGAPVLTASAVGTISGVQTETVAPGAVATLTLSPRSGSVGTGRSRRFAASAADVYGNVVTTASPSWSVTPAGLGSISPRSGGSTTFKAGSRPGRGRIVATLGDLSASAAVTVSRAVACVVPKLRGRSLIAAKRLLKLRHCALGPVGRAYSRSVRRGRVLAQKPAPGAHRPRGTRVRVVLSRGRRVRR
jgi:hypothetical protein